MPDTTILSWINAEVDQALKRVHENIAKFLTAREDVALLRVCPDDLHQVSGALRMVGLSGATLVCEAIEGSFTRLNGAKPDTAAMGVIDRAVLALKEFVGELSRGQANVPLKLYPVYRELSSLEGKNDISEKDLFFPDLTRQAPPHASPRALQKLELAIFLNSQRTRFQRGVLAWLRNQPAGLNEMQQALDALYQIAAQLPEPRSLWWVALGWIDALLDAPEPELVAQAKMLCHKLDFQIRDIAQGSQAVNDPLLRDLLYALAKSKSGSERIKEIRRLYQLEGLFPEPGNAGGTLELDMDRLQPALEDAHSRLGALKSAWLKYVSGEPKSVLRFRELVGGFKAKAIELGNQQLVKLLDAIALVATRLPDPHPRQNPFMVIEMASAFLLAESIIEHFTTPPADLDQQIVILGGWLLDAAKGKAAETPAGLRAELSEKIGALQLRAQVAKEIVANLQHIEQVLDAYARDPAKRDTLQSLSAPLRQIHGALVVLRFERAAEILAICERLIGTCADGEAGETSENIDWIAEGLSSLGMFLEPCLHGRDPAAKALELFFSRYEKRSAAAPVAEPAAASAPAPAPETDRELLSIFLDEAGEVLATIDAAVPHCAAEPANVEVLTTIRRGFHTLKGSGRMVGLTDLGEAAWQIEQLLNRWLEEKRPATPALLEFVGSTSVAFASWVAALREGKPLVIDAQPIAERAASLKALEQAPAPPAPPAPTIADSPTFLEIYIKEAREHVATLQGEFEAWRTAPGAQASHEFTRAAHTLASSSRTAGFTPLADLAAALEHLLPVADQVTEPADARTVEAAVARLGEMVEAVAERREPGPGDAAAARLHDLAARLQKRPAQPMPTATPEPQAKELRKLQDDIDEQLLPIFLEEADQLLPQIGGDLRDWKAKPDNADVARSLRRALHTLKGSARMAGAIRLGELTHLMESRIEAALEGPEYPPELFVELEEKMDRLSAELERMRSGKSEAESAARAAGPAPAQAQAPLAALPAAAGTLRVNADILDHLINEAGEVAIARSRIEAELRTFKQSLSDLGESIARLRNQLREVEVQADSQMQSRLSVLEERSREFDPLEFDRYTRLQELTRMMAESLHDIQAIEQGLAKNVGESDAALMHQARINREVQQQLMRMRAVPFSTVSERLHRIVRQTARELGKIAELEIQGSQVELDRSVLERIAAPLEHMLRNAMAHGLETPDVRAAAGKPEAGRITITLSQEANEIALVLADDGGGLDLEKLERKAVEKGLLKRGEQPSEAQLAQLIFATGISTAEAVTELSGRGIGMDVVRNEITAIGGRVEVATTRGQGTTFTIYLPLTLAVTQALIVRAASSLAAIGSAMVEQVLRLKSETMVELYEHKEIEFQGRRYRLHYLPHLLGYGIATDMQPYNSVLLLRSGAQRIALHVDALVGNQEIVVKNIGPQLARVPGVVGATVLADGAIVLIVNPVQLTQRAHTRRTQVPAPQPSLDVAAAPLVMVVDDSLTVRKITGRLLEREGYRVLTAKDGVEALELMKDTLPDVMLVDIEMPRMDGFDLAKNVRADARTAGIPIIIISSRTAEKHRNQATQLGVNAFLGKPYQEAELLQQVAAYARA